MEQISIRITVDLRHLLLSLKGLLLDAVELVRTKTETIGSWVDLLFLLTLGDRGVLVLLVLGDQVVHVALSLSELHLVHTLTSVPVQESLATEHSSELITDTLEQLLDGGGVTDEGGGHLETTGRNGAQGGLDVVGDPLDEVGLVLALDVAHLVLNLLHGDTSTARYLLAGILCNRCSRKTHKMAEQVR